MWCLFGIQVKKSCSSGRHRYSMRINVMKLETIDGLLVMKRRGDSNVSLQTHNCVANAVHQRSSLHLALTDKHTQASTHPQLTPLALNSGSRSKMCLQVCVFPSLPLKRLAGCRSIFLISLHVVTQSLKLRSAGLISRKASSAEPRKEMQQNVKQTFATR